MPVFLIPSNHNSDPQEVSAAIGLHHQPCPHHTGNFQFRCPMPLPWRSSFQTAIYSPTPIDARPSPSTRDPDPDPCQCCTARSPSSHAPLQASLVLKLSISPGATVKPLHLPGTQASFSCYPSTPWCIWIFGYSKKKGQVLWPVH